MKQILQNKEKEILFKMGSKSKSIHNFYNSASGRDRIIFKAGIWYESFRKLSYVSEPGISSSRMAYNAMQNYFENLSGEEEIFVMMLNNKNKPIEIINVTSESKPSGASLNMRKLLKTIFETNASGIILAHNHPSGELSSSQEDIKLTKDLENILVTIGVTLFDHIIITESGYAQIKW